MNKKIELVILDWDAEREKAKELKIYGIPTTIIMYNGRILERLTGVLPQEPLLECVRKYV